MRAEILKSERLILRPISLNHLSMTYVNWMNDIEVYRYLETGGNYTLEDLEKYLSEHEKKDILFWAIHIKDSQKHIGNIKIDPINQASNTGEYGIMMGDSNEWGKGYAKEASVAVIDFCFNKLKLSKITLGVVDANKNAIKLYEKLGFKKESIIENFGVYDNKTCNSIRMVKNNG